MLVKLPKLGEEAHTGVVLTVLVQRGDEVEAEQPLLEIETDKATAVVPAPQGGTVKEIKVSRGDELKAGDPVLVLETEDDDTERDGAAARDDAQNDDAARDDADRDDGHDEDEADAAPDEVDHQDDGEEDAADSSDADTTRGEVDRDHGPDDEDEPDGDDARRREGSGKGGAKRRGGAKKESGKEKHAAERASHASRQRPSERRGGAETSTRASSEHDTSASPAVRQLARELGVDDLSEVAATGPRGTVTAEDLKSHVRALLARRREQATGDALPDLERWGPVAWKPVSGLRRAIARGVSRSWAEVPHVTQGDEADATALFDAIERASERGEPRISLTALLVLVVARASRRFESLRAALDDRRWEMAVRDYVHVGVAVDTEHGLLVPVLRDADTKGIRRLTRELEDVAERARARTLDPEQMAGATITVTNLGGFGTTTFTPIIPFGQAAIVGVGRAQARVTLDEDGAVERRRFLPLSLSYDHRVLDGADAARFLRFVASALEDPWVLLA